MNNTKESYRTIGVITGAHGIQGHVVIKANDEEVGWADTLKRVILFDIKSQTSMAISSMTAVGSRVRVKFKEINTRTEAEKLKGLMVKAHEADLPDLAADEFYTDTLLGLTIISFESGKTLGTVQDVVSASQGEYLEVLPVAGGETQLIPFLEVFIDAVDTEAKTIKIKGLDSLFEPDETA